MKRNTYSLTSTIIFEPEVPPSIGLLLTQIKINQTQCYFTNSGIQAYMVITTTFSVLLFGDFTSVLFYTYVEPESVDIVNITNITKTNSPTIALNISKVIIPIAGGVAMIVLAIVVFFVLRKRLKA